MFKQVSYDEAKKILNQKEVIIADVRDIESYEDGHIKNAVHLSVSALQDFCDNSDKTQAIIVYCYHGISSQSVAQHLVDQGFTEVYSLIGGYEAWRTHHQTSE